MAGTLLPLLRSGHAKSASRFLKIAANAAKAFRKVRANEQAPLGKDSPQRSPRNAEGEELLLMVIWEA
jgi:hypothetical protein